MFRKLYGLILFFVFSIFIVSCGGSGSSNSSNNQSSSLSPLRIIVDPADGLFEDSRIDLTNAATIGGCEFNTVTVTVSGDFNPPNPIVEVFNADSEGNFGQISLFVPAGTDRTFGLALGDCCAGSTTVDIIPDTTNTIFIECDLPDENCSNLVDDNLNNLIDCDEGEQCLGQICDNSDGSVCVEISNDVYDCVLPEVPDQVEICDNGENDDDDIFTDCFDSDCELDDACPEDCDDEVDNDGDGNIDCDDQRCVFDPVCFPEQQCIDCSEPGCMAGDPCGTGSGAECQSGDFQSLKESTDQISNELFGYVCVETSCSDGSNNDGNGGTDCSDVDCFGASICEFPEESCTDDFDNDGDGNIDCDDSNCVESNDCFEDFFSCDDGVDNDIGVNPPDGADCLDASGDCEGADCTILGSIGCCIGTSCVYPCNL